MNEDVNKRDNKRIIFMCFIASLQLSYYTINSRLNRQSNKIPFNDTVVWFEMASPCE